MPQIYWRGKDAPPRVLVEKPFVTEMAFEDYVVANQYLLGDVFVFSRQIRTGQKQGIPDLIGVDQDGRIVLIELKNAVVCEDVLPQVLGYAIWAETNPDSLRAMWLSSKDRPDDMEINWDTLDLRIQIIGPDFRPALVRMAAKLGYPVELIQANRFCLDEEEFLVVESPTPDAAPKPTITKAQGTYDRAFYESQHGKPATDQFARAVEQIDALIAAKEWPLERKFNKYYVGYKLGGSLFFGVEWAGTYAWSVFVKGQDPSAEANPYVGWQLKKYDSGFNQTYFRADNLGAPDPSGLAALLEAGYLRLAAPAKNGSSTP